MPPGSGRERLLGVHRALDELLARRRLHGLPDLAGRLALEAGGVREHPPERRRVRALRDVEVERVVERELPVVAELEDADGREGLRDRADPVLGLGRGDRRALDVRETDGVLPEQLVAPEDGGADRRRPLLGLGRTQPPDELLAEGLRR